MTNSMWATTLLTHYPHLHRDVVYHHRGSRASSSTCTVSVSSWNGGKTKQWIFYAISVLFLSPLLAALIKTLLLLILPAFPLSRVMWPLTRQAVPRGLYMRPLGSTDSLPKSSNQLQHPPMQPGGSTRTKHLHHPRT